jgi:predicted nucleic acid-binding protein
VPFVLDASVAACWAFRDENHPVATHALTLIRSGEVAVPSLFWFEVRNILVVNERRGRISKAETDSFLGFLPKLPIIQDRSPDETRILHFARSHRLTVYDAAYLELAQREGSPLATLDAALARAARSEGVKLLGR